MRIEMPQVNLVIDSDWPLVTPLLVKSVEDGEIGTVILGPLNALFFNKDGFITYSDLEYLKTNYKVIRRYKEGEKLTITI